MCIYIYIFPYISSPFILFQAVLPPLLMSFYVFLEIACLKQVWGSDQYTLQLRTFIWFGFFFLFGSPPQLKKPFMLGLK